MEALRQRLPQVHFHIFTQVPQWFFEDTLGNGFTYHHCVTDVGLIQRTPWEEDLKATADFLQTYLPFEQTLVETLRDEIRQTECQAILCDIAPLGIAVARKANLPAILVENFTWDWIYEGYMDAEPRLASAISYYREIFSQATYRIQTQPFCAPAPCDLIASPVSRRPKHSRHEVRARLGIDEASRAVLITMGGIEQRYTALDALKQFQDVVFIIPGSAPTFIRDANLILLPHRSGFYHPDLLHASDAVIGKVGYSTLAEAYHAGIPFGFSARERFRESGPLVAFIEQHMPSLPIPPARFLSGEWVNDLPSLLSLPKCQDNGHLINGADQIAEFLLESVL